MTTRPGPLFPYTTLVRSAEAARSAVDGEALVIPEASALEDVVPDREERLGQRRGTDHVESVGNGQDLRRRRSAVFGIAPTGQEGADLLADLQVADAHSQRDDGSGHLQAGQGAGPGGRRIAALALQHVGPVDAGGGDLDQP